MFEKVKLKPWHLLFVYIFSLSCQTAPKNLSQNQTKDFNQGTWSLRIYVEDEKQKLDHRLTAKAFIDWPQKKLRLEVVSALGTPVLSLMQDSDQMTAVVHTEKKYYAGPVKDKILKSLLGLNVSPLLLYSALMRRAPGGQDWLCQADSGVLQKCLNQKLDLSLNWLEGDYPECLIQEKSLKLRILTTKFEPQILDPTRAFKVIIPSSYSRY